MAGQSHRVGSTGEQSRGTFIIIICSVCNRMLVSVRSPLSRFQPSPAGSVPLTAATCNPLLLPLRDALYCEQPPFFFTAPGPSPRHAAPHRNTARRATRHKNACIQPTEEGEKGGGEVNAGRYVLSTAL